MLDSLGDETINQNEEDLTKTSEENENKEMPNEETSDGFDLSKDKDLALLLRKKDDDTIKREIRKHIDNIIKKSNLNTDYKIIFLYDPVGDIMDYDLNKINGSLPLVANGEKIKKILLILHSNGGYIEPAYLISKLCKERAEKFIVVVPGKAKSAATLLALGADEIHMGTISQLGPIDPQIGGRSVLTLGNAVEYLAKLSEKYPGSSDMLAKYLSTELDLKQLGHFERISESAAQYGEMLLDGRKFSNGMTAREIAEKFTFFFKDHGFVIDRKECEKYLDNIKSVTPELALGEELFSWLNNLDFYLDWIKKKYIIISGDHKGDGLILLKKPEPNN